MASARGTYGWFFGVALNLVITGLRSPPLGTPGIAGVILDVFSEVVVTLIFAIPALLALIAARFAE